MDFVLGGLNWCRFGGFGRSLILITATTADHFYGFKWRDNSRRWTNRVKILRTQLLGPVQLDDLSSPVVRRASAAMKDQLCAEVARG